MLSLLLAQMKRGPQELSKELYETHSGRSFANRNIFPMAIRLIHLLFDYFGNLCGF